MSLLHPHFSHSHTPAPGFSSLFRLLDDFDRYVAQGTETSISAFTPKFDVAEHAKEYVLQGELPGVSPENVEIEFADDHTLVVRGRSERTHTEGDVSLLEAPAEQKQIEGAEGGKKETVVTKGKEGKEGEEAAAKSKPRYWLSERSYGEFSRSFNLPAGVDQDNVKAKFKDGILTITVPKAEKKTGRRIPIS
ncbi:30 kDa heat shock protein [Achaetomium macrosporum]|uniref:30 kDa heat shock protein n=1 Tax=Achaetomium macrosporum TaxID=79813 RepID=A0AAN7H8U1_9PEZI|nr:30 kDa heat shock protein [Achaetomium macrosporum]